MRALDDNTEPPWRRIAPLLDEGLNQLSASDRDAIVLRFLKRQDLRAVGAAMGIGEDAAQKRVSRAVEKLRAVLARRGIALTATTLASAMTTEAVTAAPAGLALGVTTVAMGATAQATGALTLLMASTKLKAGLAGAILVASVVTPFVIQHRAQGKLRSASEALQQQSGQLALVAADNQRLAGQIAGAGTPALPSEQWSELLRVRGEVARLRKEVQDLARPKPPTPLPRHAMLAALAQRYAERAGQLRQFLDSHPAENIPELQLLDATNWLYLAGLEMPDTEEGYRRAMSMARRSAEGRLAGDFLLPALQKFAQENNGQFPRDISELTPYFPTALDDVVLQRWHVLHASRLIHLRANLEKEDWVLTQKAPVNRALDQRLVVGRKETHALAEGPPKQWDISP